MPPIPEPPSSPSRPTIVGNLVQAITILGAAIAISVTRGDPDLWGHVRFGQDLLHSWTLSPTDPYSFTADPPWVNHEWLSEVIFALAYGVTGPTGLIALKLVIVASAVALLLRIYRRDGARQHTLFVIGILTVVAVLPRAQQIRPQLFSLLYFAALVAVLRRAERGPSQVLWLASPVMMLWANSHGGWIVGCATIGGWTIGRIWQVKSDPKRWLLPCGACAAAILSTLVNPYGTELWTFLAETVGPSRRYIQEWGPLIAVPQLLVAWLVFATLGASVLRRSGVPPNIAHALIPVAWGVAALKVSRLDSFFALSVLGFLSGPITTWFNARNSASVNIRSEHNARRWPLVAGGTLCAFALVGWPFRSVFTCIDVHGPTMPEPEATRFVRDERLQGRMITYFDWGQYTIWHMPSGLRISMDGRRETVYRDNTVDNHLDFYLGKASGLSYAHQLVPDYIWLPRTLPVVAQLEEMGWSSIFEGPVSTILAQRPPRIRPASVKAIESQTTPPCRCFPGP